MASEIRVDKITSLSGVGTISPSPTGVEIAGITTVGILTSTGAIFSGTSLNAKRLNVVGPTPRIYLTDTNNNDDYQVRNENGTFEVRNDTDSVNVFTIEKGPANTATFSSTTKVGTGITLSPDGDVFATGITTIGTSSQVGGKGTVVAGGNSNQLSVHAGYQVGMTTFVFGDTQVGSAVTDIAHFEISNKTNNGIAIAQDDDSNIAYIRRRDNGGKIGFMLRHGTQNRERLRIQANGNVGIGTTLPSATVDVNGTAIVKGATVNSGAITMNSSHLQFSGQLSLPNVGATIFRPLADTIAFGINNGQRVSINQHGLLFGTDTAFSNALDDYEEGDWTPTFESGSGSITVNAYAVQYGKYVKIGKMVYVEGLLRANVTNNSNGTYDIGGLPFTVANTPNASGIIHAKEQNSWTVAPHHFSCMNNTTKARARGGIDVGDNSYSNANTSGFNSGSTNNNRVYVAGCYRAEG